MVSIYTAIAIFGMAAIIGMYLLSLVLRNKETPKGVAVIHGLFAVAGLLLLIIYVLRNNAGPMVSVVIFVIAALAGLILFYRDISGKKIPKWLAIMHGLVAVAGFVYLLVFAFCRDCI